MKKLYFTLLILLATTVSMWGSDPLRVIVFGAHPDDCEGDAGGVAALYVQMGHKVKFVSMTNGDKGHQTMKPKELAERRYKEAMEAAKVLGVEYEVLDNHDGELMPTLENRLKVIRLICDWKADIVIAPRPNDYHPDHRYTSQLVQDAAYMVSVPQMVEGGEPLLKEPVYLYTKDGFTKPTSFVPDILVDITPVVEKKARAFYVHESQAFEWLPWNGGYEDQIPKDAEGRWKRTLERTGSKMTKKYVDAALKWYSLDQLKDITHFEAFEICEYGHIPSHAEILKLFPMLPQE